MILYQPRPAEAAYLLCNPPHFRGYAICANALPPAFLLERAMAPPEEPWQMPRLFCDEVKREIVGSAIFKQPPKERRIEIGYGVALMRCCRGYATAGVELMVTEAFASSEVDCVFAETLVSNHASRRVLEKSGFTIYASGVNEEGPVDWWERRYLGPVAPPALSRIH